MGIEDGLADSLLEAWGCLTAQLTGPNVAARTAEKGVGSSV
jgi:hypothetical protein